MAVSARNQLTGTVSAVAAGAVNDEVELTSPAAKTGGDRHPQQQGGAGSGLPVKKPSR